MYCVFEYCSQFTIYVFWEVFLRSEKYFCEVWKVFLGGLGSIEFDTKYLRVPCLDLLVFEYSTINCTVYS